MEPTSHVYDWTTEFLFVSGNDAYKFEVPLSFLIGPQPVAFDFACVNISLSDDNRNAFQNYLKNLREIF